MCILMEQAQLSQGPLSSTIITAKAATKLLKKGAPYLLLHLADTTPDTRIAGSENPCSPLPLLALGLRSDQPGSHLEANMPTNTTGSVEEGQSHPRKFAQHIHPPALQTLLEDKKEVFPKELPYGVPPDRETGEAIPLTDFNKIPFRRSYHVLNRVNAAKVNVTLTQYHPVHPGTRFLGGIKGSSLCRH